VAVPTWNGQKEAKEFTKAPGTGKPKPKGSAKKAVNVLAIADHRCEFDKTDRVFARKNGVGYTEPHHLILISKHDDFDYSLDVEENIVSLCSHCHNLLHYGRKEDKKPILIKLLNDRKDALRKVGLEIDLDRLMEYYK
jgi:hypothetical protein